MFAVRVLGAMALSLFTCIMPVLSGNAPVDPADPAQDATCRSEDGPGFAKAGAAMIQRSPKKSMSSMLQRVNDEAPRAPMKKSNIMSDQERVAVRAHAANMGRQAVAVQTMLRRAEGLMKGSQLPENALDTLIYNLMKEQGSSGDACPAKLLEAKHQLNTLHKHMYSVAYEINHTSMEVKSVTKEIETLEAEWTIEKGECEDGKEKCTTEIEWYKKQWEILKWELIEMQTIANPAVTITDMSYAAYKSREESEESSASNKTTSYHNSTEDSWQDSGDGEMPEYDGLGEKPNWWPNLLQAKAGREAPGSMSAAQAVSSLVKSTRNSAKDLDHCFAQFQQAGGDRTSLMGKVGQPMGGSSTYGDKENSGGGNWTVNKTSNIVPEKSAGNSNDLGGSGYRNKSSESSEESSEHDWSRSFSNSSSSFSNISEACKLQLIAFEKTYYKAYRQVTRLVSEYEVLVNNTECEDAVIENCKEQDGEYSIKEKRETEKLGEKTERMSHIKGHITVTSNQEKSLTQHIKVLAQTCADMDETISDLDKVRDAIQIFGVCAGMGRPNFHIPVFAAIIELEYDTTSKTDDMIDGDFNYACYTANLTKDDHVARAAETSEIMQQAIEGMPATNTAESVIMGTCPHCQGDMDAPDGPVHASGYFRTCWDSGAELDGATMRSNCGHLSYKAIMCVFDRFDVITVTSGNSTTITSISGGSSSSSSSSGSSSSSSSTSSSSSGSSVSEDSR